MQKAIILSVLVMGALANIDDFPRFDIFHNHCEIRALYPNRTCTDVYHRMSGILTGFTGEDPAKGKYAFVETTENDHFWMLRRSPAGYKDDVGLWLTQSAAGCQVQGKARARSMTMFNDGATYCDIWNVIKYTDVFVDLKTVACRIVPKDPTDFCVAY